MADIDHINLDRADNRWLNLREATRSQNKANTSIRADNASGFKGVYWDRWRSTWKAAVKVRGKRRYLGYFDTPEAAHAAYVAAAQDAFGEFAK